MVDIHCHIVPGVDDGAQDMDEAVAMVELARECGTTILAGSPHADPHYEFDAGRNRQLLEELQRRVGSGIELVTACDFHLTTDNIEAALARPQDYAIAGKRYVLMELSDMLIFPNTGELWGRLEDGGLKIILTHPERNPLLRQRPELIRQWVAEGRYMQVTGQSLLGLFGPQAKKFACWMLDEGLVHIIASDGHDPKGRPPRLDKAAEWIQKNYSARLTQLLTEIHPRKVVLGEDLDLTDFPPIRTEKSGFWSRLIRNS